jgi:hypothetical protein
MKDAQLPKPAVKLKMNRRKARQEKKRRQKNHMNTVLSEERGERQSQFETEYLWEKNNKWEQQCDKSAALDIHGKSKKGIHRRYIYIFMIINHS